MKKPFISIGLTALTSTVWAQAAPAPAASGTGSIFSSLMFPLVLFGALFFLMIWPQMRQQKKAQKERDAMMDALAKGDEIVTSGGMLGKVSKLGETYVSIEVANNTEVQIQRAAITQVLPKGSMK
jgi:preprotein translocase subunit YajC